MRRAKPQPWFSDIRHRSRFERGARKAFSGLECRVGGRRRTDWITYRISVQVPYYETREVEIRIQNDWEPRHPRMTVDGPTASPHRYEDGALCIWDPRDPAERRWEDEDGLLVLIQQIRVHLFKEAWWRETGEWLGEEAEHDVKDMESGS